MNYHYFLKKVKLLFLCLVAGLIYLYAGANTEIKVPEVYEPNKVNQDVTIIGRVIDEGGRPLYGVTVQLKNATRITTTDTSGRYKIIVPSSGGILRYTMIGYETQERIIGNQKNINISMKKIISDLDEVVVIGYGTQKRLSLSASVTSAKAEDIEKQVVSNPISALAAQMPGVEIRQTQGMPGENPVVRIRGVGSLGGGTASNEPLYVVDGIPLENPDDFNSINANDIASVDVLKDAAASAIYGARGGNGVILITTKKGKAGTSKLDFTYYTGFQNVTKKIEMLNKDQFIQFQKEITSANWESMGGNPAVPNGQRVIGGQRTQYNYPVIFDTPDSLPNTDWQDEIFRKSAPMSNYQIAASGGNERLSYFISGNYLDQTGLIRRTGFKRYTARANLDAVVNKLLKVGATFSPSYTSTDRLPTNGHFNGPNNEPSTILSALGMPPTIIGRYSDGLYGSTFGEYISAGFNAIRTPLQSIYEPNYRNQQTVFRFTGSMYSELSLLKYITLRTNLGADYRSNKLSYYRPSTIAGVNQFTRTPGYPDGRVGLIQARENEDSYLTMSWDNTLNYIRKFKKEHDINVLAGYSVQQYLHKGFSLIGQSGTFVNDLVPYPSGAASINGSNVINESALISYFGRINYGFQNKYLISAALRNDASSRFPEGKKAGLFPSVSAAWRISREGFFKQVRVINELKLRASYGITGNYPGSMYPYQSILQRVDYNFNDVQAIGYAPNRLETKDLTWETNRTIDLGLDIAFFKNRINLNVDYYQRNTTNLLYNVPVPPVSGFTTAFGNVGELENKGFEISLNSVNYNSKGFKWTSILNLSTNRNKIKHIGLDDADIFASFDAPLVTILRVGQPMASFYGYKTAGVFTDKADLEANSSMKFSAGSGLGDTKFVDTNGDGIITSDDRIILGNPNPDFTYGISNRFSYKTFDLDIQLQGVEGGEILFLVQRFYGVNNKGFNQLTYSAINRWKSPEEPGNGIMPRAPIQARGNSVGINESDLDRWLFDGSYLRIRNVTLGYRIPANITRNSFLRSMKMYVSVQNLYTFTKYIGYDPDANYFGQQANMSGVDYGNYPQSRIFTFGINLGL